MFHHAHHHHYTQFLNKTAASSFPIVNHYLKFTTYIRNNRCAIGKITLIMVVLIIWYMLVINNVRISVQMGWLSILIDIVSRVILIMGLNLQLELLLVIRELILLLV